jgi:hypothetical protein
MKILFTKTLYRITAVVCLLFNGIGAHAQYALQFTKSSSQYVAVPHSASLNLTTSFTMEAFVNYSGQNVTIVDKGNYDYLWSLNANNNGNKMGFYMFSTNTWVYSNGAVPQNTLTHVAITLSSGTITFYINGVASGTASAFTAQDNQPLNIGRQQPTSCQCNHFNGTMDELRIWNIARTQAEIQANMSSSISNSSSGLVAYYKFNEGSGTTTADATANGNNGTLVNGPTFVANSTSGCDGTVANISATGQDAAQTSWTVPAGGPYKIRITAKGGRGGSYNSNNGGSGAVITGEFIVNTGQVLSLIAGGPGASNQAYAGAGGAGSAAKIGQTLLLVAGGGGGAGAAANQPGGGGRITTDGGAGTSAGGTNGTGGAGSSSSYGGAGGGGAFSAGGNNPGYNAGGGGAGFNALGGIDPNSGTNKGGSGFGGGGAALGFDTNPLGGGGGGGYSGGGGSENSLGGGGGGSYNTGDNQTNTASANAAGGAVMIECLGRVCQPGNIAYVNAAVASSGNGGSWAGAFKTLQEALTEAGACSNITQIWVATGTYIPSDIPSYIGNTDPRRKTFLLKSNLSVYGGFAGTEALLTDRNVTTNATILSGDLGIPGDNGDNTYNVVTCFSFTNVRVDGFTITGGSANEGDLNQYKQGGGLNSQNSTIAVANCTFTGNNASGFGGGLCNDVGTVVVSNSTFTSNSAGTGGGGLANINGGTSQLTDCRFTTNTSGNFGGGIYTSGGTFTGTSCFINNNSGANGAGIFCTSSTASLTNCVIASNNGRGVHLGFGGSASLTNCTITGSVGADGLYSASITPVVKNSIIWGNNSGIGGPATVSYSDVQGSGVYAGTGNINADPLFASATDFHIGAGSSAINTGTNTGAPAADIEGSTRPLTVADPADMGAYESDPCTIFSASIAYVNDAVTSSGSGGTWGTAFKTLQEALTVANTCSSITQVWVAKGTYYPDEGGSYANNDRFSRFNMRNNLVVLGGFAGNEATGYDLSLRNFTTNETILSGDVGTSGNADDNCNVVVAFNVGCTVSSVINGFTVSGAHSINLYDGAGIAVLGGASPTITNCILRNNVSPNQRGGGIFISSGSSTVSNCSFYNNTAYVAGGGLSNLGTAVVSNCVFDGNTVTLYNGGGIYNAGTISIDRCSFTNNVGSGGGGIAVLGGTATITNCTLANNTSNAIAINPSATITVANCTFYNTISGFHIASQNTMPISNCIFWGTGAVYNGGGSIGNCIVQGGFTPCTNCPGGDGNVNPQFVSSTNLRLSTCSPAINAGNDAANTTITDLDGNLRKFATIDLGAYESTYGYPIAYVNGAVASSGNGGSWATAFKTLQEALTAANACSNITQVWVAKGTYYPDEGGSFANSDRNASFSMKNNLAIYGGFAGYEAPNYILASRNFLTNETILSGDIDQNDGANFANNNNNAYHVINNNGIALNATAILNGFSLAAGNADGGGISGQGGGIFLSGSGAANILQCKFYNNSAVQGGAIYCTASSPAISLCTFENNRHTGSSGSEGGGGIMVANNSSPDITRSTFTGNSSGYTGGAISVFASPAHISDCVFSHNSSVIAGGAVHFQDCAGANIVTNSTFYQNTTQYGAGVSNTNSNVSISNSIFWNNTATSSPNISVHSYSGVATNLQYCLIQEVTCPAESNFTCGAGMIYGVDPLFVNAAIGDFRLTSCSPAVDKGNDAANASITDLDGNNRKFGVIDLGAYELQQPQTSPALPTAGLQVDRTISPNDTWSFIENCNLVAKLSSNGLNAVTGPTQARVWVEATAPTHNNQPYVRRHYQIAPYQNAAAATGTVTLYFTQADFTNFNDRPGTMSLLPTGKDDATGISHFAIYKLSGSSNDETGVPSSYPSPGTINAVPNVQLTWNEAGEWWEATFTVTGFSGFFAGSKNNPLPLSDLLNFTVGRNGEDGAAIKWQVIPDHKIDRFELQKSYDGRRFTTLERIPVTTGITSYGVTDSQLQGGLQYYRLKLFDNDGSESYSRIISFQWDEIQLTKAYPNPFGNTLKLSLSAVRAGNVEVSMINLHGQTMAQRTFGLSAGSNTLSMDIENLSSGVYLLHYRLGGSSGFLRVVKK